MNTTQNGEKEIWLSSEQFKIFILKLVFTDVVLSLMTAVSGHKIQL